MDSAVFLIEFGSIILVLGLLGRVAGWLKFSPIPLYLLAGLAFGGGGLLPLGASEEFVAIGAGIGVILLLMLGLEYTAADLVTNLKTPTAWCRARSPTGSRSATFPTPTPPAATHPTDAPPPPATHPPRTNQPPATGSARRRRSNASSRVSASPR